MRGWTVGDWLHYVIDVALILALILLLMDDGRRASFADRFSFPQAQNLLR